MEQEDSHCYKNTRKNHALWKRGGAPKEPDNPLKSEWITAKRLLRKAQRQLMPSNEITWPKQQ